ncbi:hypothetical protein ACUUL3_15645 [Thiovibrio sp. JS02]
MMALREKSGSGLLPAEFGLAMPMPPEEGFVKGVYAAVDEATAGELARLRREEGVVPPCGSGCCHCCRYHILTNIAEAHTLAQHLKREWSAAQLDGLRLRTQQWHAWDNSRPGRPAVRSMGRTELAGYEHCCPLLVNGACGAYPVRPVVCRAHFVSSHPDLCSAANDPAAAVPTVLASVAMAAMPSAGAIRGHLADRGWESSRTMMLLPQWLAIEMGWDFAIPL